MRALIRVAAGVFVLGAAIAAQPAAPAIPPGAERAYHAVKDRVDGAAAMDIVRFMDQFWRVSGNPGFNASVDRIRDDLKAAGLDTRVEEFASRERGWEYQVGTVAFADTGEVLLSRERDRVSLCINSLSTPPGGIDVPVVDVGAGTAADFAGKDVRGAVVLGSAAAGQLWQQAVKARGAAGIISTAIAPYIRPNDPARFTFPDQHDVFQWGSVPYDAAAKAFGFKASLRVATKIRERLKSGPVRVKVDVQSTFYDGPSRMVVAEIPGTVRPHERIVMVAHIQEPGANDDASGCGTLLAMAIALHEAIAAKALPPPGRTLTFIWGDENHGSRAWLTAHPEQARGVQYMFSMDMTGEDTAKTGGTFLIEKQADPSAVWDRPSDPHSAWGSSAVKPDELKGSLLNDLHLAICRRRAKDTGWIVKTNPYEGGSDHTEFKNAGIPSLLNWHFTDRFYHTNLDRPDKVSAAEMVNVGVATATSAWFLASATERDALATVDLIATAASARLALEKTQNATPEILSAWRKWYGEALDSVRRLSVRGPSAAVDRAVASVDDRALRLRIRQRCASKDPAQRCQQPVRVYRFFQHGVAHPVKVDGRGSDVRRQSDDRGGPRPGVTFQRVHACAPSMPGMLQSIRIASGASSRALATASAPLIASVTAYPDSVRHARQSWRTSSLSSATRMACGRSRARRSVNNYHCREIRAAPLFRNAQTQGPWRVISASEPYRPDPLR